MPTRIVPFIDGEYYHCFNKTINGDGIFSDPKITQTFREMVWYYHSRNAKRRYSHFSRLKGEIKSDFVEALTDPASFNADIIAYSIMPNHFHLVLRQCTGGLIEHMMRNALISFTRYFNTLKKRKGPLFFYSI